jgi:NADH-quinone oxidoreductase subunit N
LVALAAVNAAAGAVYYLRALGAMYLRPPLTAAGAGGGLLPLAAAVICAVGTLVFGVYPDPLAKAARLAAPAPAAVTGAPTR